MNSLVCLACQVKKITGIQQSVVPRQLNINNIKQSELISICIC